MVGLPNMVNYRLGGEIGSPCDTILNVNNSTSISEFLIEIFPNPVFEILNVTVNKTISSEIILYDIVSRKIFQKEFIKSISLNIGQMHRGLYLYEVRSKDGSIKKGKVVKY